ncbi:MAG: outer membrane lipoprotein carrier protein LolA [Bacteroidales bacterium]|nr:outer membrane lipoprotein carrier protein LolA [Bacteroidales bacterium]
MKKIFLTIVLLGQLSLYAQVRIANLSSASASFCQTKVSVALMKPEIQYGHFSFTAPDQISWKYQNNSTLQMPAPMLDLIRKTVSGDFSVLEKEFALQWNKQELVMTPQQKQIKRIFSSITIVFDVSGVAKKVILKEVNGDVTTIEFMNLKYTKQ